MFAGIEDVDWGSMEHAYGSAAEVPGLLWGLASGSAAERELALDRMYAAVHHQGDVYDSTLACIPFLFELAADRRLLDRGEIVGLLVSVAGDGDDQGGEDLSGNTGNWAMAEAAVRGGADVFAGLVADADAGVRRAVPRALVLFHEDPAWVLLVLQKRLADEPERAVRLALVEALGLHARRHPALVRETVPVLSGLTAAPYEAGVRLSALGCLAQCAPDQLPTELVPLVVQLMRDRRGQPRPAPPGQERTVTGTLIGPLRRLRAPDDGTELLRSLQTALGDRVGERITLLAEQLRSPEAAERCSAVWMSAGLVRGWRGGYAEVVGLIGEQLHADDGLLRDPAGSVLGDFFGLAGPAADALAGLVAADPRQHVRYWEHGWPTLGGPLKALVRCGDARAVPALAEVLELPELPSDLGYQLEHLGEAARPLVPALRDRLTGTELSECAFDRDGHLLYGLARLGDAAAVPEVVRLLREAQSRRHPALVEAAVRALGAFGPAAGDAAPELRRLLGGASAVEAAEALWAVAGDADADAVLPVLLAGLTADDQYERRAAARVLGQLGPRASAAVPRLRELLRADDLWERTESAMALGQVTGDTHAVLPVLRAAWEANPYVRIPVAEYLASLGRSAAEPRVGDLLRAELAAGRRHNARAGVQSSHDIPDDLRLQSACARALAEVPPAGA